MTSGIDMTASHIVKAVIVIVNGHSKQKHYDY